MTFILFITGITKYPYRKNSIKEPHHFNLILTEVL